MKTAFALAFLAAGTEAAIKTVTGEWKAKAHVAPTALQICAAHDTKVDSGASNKITYTYGAGFTCTAASTTATTATELTWGTGTDKATAEGTGAQSATATCLIDDTAKTVTCNTVAVAAAGFSCVKLLKCRPLAQSSPATQINVKSTSVGDTAAVDAGGAVDFASVLNTVTITKPTTAEAKVGAAEFTMELKLTAATEIASGKVVTIVAPGYKFLKDGVCTLKDGAATANAADSTGSVSFLSTAASTTAEVDLKCTKVQAVTAMAASQFAVISGGAALNDLTTVTNAGFVASPVIAAAATTAAPGDSASTVSLSAAALLLAASMYL